MPEHAALAPSRQLLLVIAPRWESSTGVLYQYERPAAGAPWVLRQSFAVNLGKAGLAWGKGLHGGALSPGPTKREGDQKSPAGIFALGPAFGYAPPAEGAAHAFPYVHVTENTYGIEDPASTHYNTVVDGSQVRPDWRAADHMLRADDLYRYGVVVQHNAVPGPQPAALGSCIFLHVQRGAGQGTAGCTSMEQGKMAELLAWLREDAQPRLVQLTAGDFAQVAAPWGLPQLAVAGRATSPISKSPLGWLGLGIALLGAGAWLLARRRRQASHAG